MIDKDIKIRKTVRFDLQRRAVSHMTSASWQNIPHVSYIYEPDITDFYNEFKKLAKERSNLGQKLTFNTIMIKIIVEGLLHCLKLYHRRFLPSALAPFRKGRRSFISGKDIPLVKRVDLCYKLIERL